MPKSRHIGASFTEDEILFLDAEAERQGVRRGNWIRDVLLSECGHVKRRQSSRDTERVRVLVQITNTGEWRAFGSTDNTDCDNLEVLDYYDFGGEPEVVDDFVLIADIPVPHEFKPEEVRAALRVPECSGSHLSFEECGQFTISASHATQ